MTVHFNVCKVAKHFSSVPKYHSAAHVGLCDPDLGRLKICTPVTPALGNVCNDFIFSVQPFVFELGAYTDKQTGKMHDAA